MRGLHTAIASGVVALAFVGCNAILDNQPGVLVESDESGTLPAPAPAPAPTEEPDTGAPIEDAGETPAEDAAPPMEAGPAACPAGQQRCSGMCVPGTDPRFGCGSPSCAPCVAAHATSACAANRCAIGACAAGFADCNANAGDGCESDLSKPTTCGACNAACGAAAPKCVPAGPTFQCTTGCAPAAPLLCGAECVNPLTSVTHCGGCNVACPAVANGTTACAAGACTFTCAATFNACAGRCVANDDVTACGAACTACPVVPNATPACAAGACGLVCAAGFGSCDANPANGCEAVLATDPANCGACGKLCFPGLACVAGVCTLVL